jgi:hypothetical protein
MSITKIIFFYAEMRLQNKATMRGEDGGSAYCQLQNKTATLQIKSVAVFALPQEDCYLVAATSVL